MAMKVHELVALCAKAGVASWRVAQSCEQCDCELIGSPLALCSESGLPRIREEGRCRSI